MLERDRDALFDELFIDKAAVLAVDNHLKSLVEKVVKEARVLARDGLGVREMDIDIVCGRRFATEHDLQRLYVVAERVTLELGICFDRCRHMVVYRCGECFAAGGSRNRARV